MGLTRPVRIRAHCRRCVLSHYHGLRQGFAGNLHRSLGRRFTPNSGKSARANVAPTLRKESIRRASAGPVRNGDAATRATSSGPSLRTSPTPRPTGRISSAASSSVLGGASSCSRLIPAVEPVGPPLRRHQQRHPIMYVGQLADRCGGDHTAAHQRAVRPLPDRPEAGEGEHTAVGSGHEIRLLGGRVPAYPLVPAVGRHQAAALGERPGVRVGGGHRLGPGVDHPRAAPGILRPGRHQPPAGERERAPPRAGSASGPPSRSSAGPVPRSSARPVPDDSRTIGTGSVGATL